MSILHNDKERFRQIVSGAASQSGFSVMLMEKDYYLTILLSKIDELSNQLVFKGGTCLNKIYYSYYRLSEDLDFTMMLPDEEVSRSIRRQCMKSIKKNIESFAQQLGMTVAGLNEAGRNESKQYVYYFIYPSVFQPGKQRIKLEIGLRFNPLCKTEKRAVQHKFVNPFNNEFLLEAGEVTCLCLDEVIAEKLRAASTRMVIAPRDFYDLDFVFRQGFQLEGTRVLELFKKKLKEDNFNSSMDKYRNNLGRTDNEITLMASNIEQELFDVLTLGEKENFNLEHALARINRAMSKVK